LASENIKFREQGDFNTPLSHIDNFSGSWDDVFKVSVGLYLVGTVVWNLFSTGEKIID
jgi:hypothetical protein